MVGGNCTGKDHPTPAQHAHPVAVLQDLAEAMADDDDGGAFRGDRSHHAVELLQRVLGQCASRLVEYQQAAEEMIWRTTTGSAPWFVVPADHKWYRNWAVSSILVETLARMGPEYPTVHLQHDLSIPDVHRKGDRHD